MPNAYKIFLIIIVLILNGCSQSFIKLIIQEDSDPYRMFGKNSKREFYSPVDLSDSLKLLWENDAHGNFTNSSVVRYDSNLFVSDLSGRVHSYDLQTGKLRGVLKTKGAIYSAPIIFDYRFVYPLCSIDENETQIISYDFKESRELFRKNISGRVITELIADDNDIVLCTDNGHIKKISEVGKEIWNTNINSQIYSNPAAINKKLVVTTTDGDFIVINLIDGTILVRRKIGVPFFSGITLKESTAYTADDKGIIYAIDISDGNILWNYDSKFRILMTPALDNENLFVGNLNGDLISINYLTGKLNWKKNYDGLFNSTPLITNNRIIIVDLASAFFSIDKSNGEIINKYPLDGRGKLSPVLVGNKIIIGFDNAKIRAYEIIY